MNVLKKSLNMLSRSEKRTGVFLLCFTVLKGVSETIGIASILPFLSVLAKPDLVETNPYASRIYQSIGSTSIDDFLFMLGLLVLFILVMSALLKVATVYATNRWLASRELSLSRKLLQTYLRQPYSYFLTRNTSKMGTLILQEAQNVVSGVYQPAVNLFNSGTSFVLISALLVWANPLITVTSIAAIGTSYLLLYLCLRGLTKSKGEIMLKANQMRFRRVNETFSGIKQVKLSSSENFAFTRYSEAARELAQTKALTNTISRIPRYGLEIIAFGGIIALTLTLFKKNDGSIDSTLPLLGLYVFAGIRLLPILQTMYNSFIRFRLSISAIDNVYKDINNTNELPKFPRSDIAPMPFDRSIRVESVYYNYPEASAPGLQKIELEIRNGENLGIVGTTGAGKTTLVDVLLGLLEPSGGSIFIDEARLDTNNVRNWQANVGYVPQSIFLSDTSIAENIAIGVEKSQISAQKLERAAKTAKLYQFITNDLPNGFETVIGERGVRLSGGQQQRLGIARALYNEPQVLIFDEATSALDNTTEHELISEISQMSGQRTIIMIAHRLSTIRNCDRIVLLDKGKISQTGTYDDLIEKNSEFRKMASNY